jgi:hypothetical protein
MMPIEDYGLGQAQMTIVVLAECASRIRLVLWFCRHQKGLTEAFR